jgi:hypothetical protein
MCSVDLNMGTVSSITHIKMIFSFLPGSENHFVHNALSSSDDSVMHQLVHILHFVMINHNFYKLSGKKFQRSKIWRARRPGNGFPSPCPMIRKLPVKKGREVGGTPSDWKIVLSGT